MLSRIAVFTLFAATAASPVLIHRQVPTASPAILAPGQDTADPTAFLLYNADQM
jgi:hypothetical protein